MAVGFDAAFDPGQFGIGQQFGPAAQVESGLGLVRRQFNGQRCHARKVGLRRAECNLGERVCARVALSVWFRGQDARATRVCARVALSVWFRGQDARATRVCARVALSPELPLLRLDKRPSLLLAFGEMQASATTGFGNTNEGQPMECTELSLAGLKKLL